MLHPDVCVHCDVSRNQIPLELCHAATVHSCQGATASSPGGVVYNRTDRALFASGLTYVAISRCQSIKDLLLQKPIAMHHFKTHESVLDAIKAEYKRLATAFPQRVSDRELRQQRAEILKCMIV